MKKKQLIGLAMTAMMLAVTACGSPGAGMAAGGNAAAEASKWKWERNVEIVCPWGSGGGSDTTARQFGAALEKQLGVNVVISNKPGDGGVTGVQFALSKPADGYTYFLCTPSVLLAQISGATNLDVFHQVKPLFQIVHDCNIFVTSGNAPYSSFDELTEYIDRHPGQVRCGVMTIDGLDAACVKGTFGDKVEAVAYTEGSKLNEDVIGGHIDLACVGPAEISALIESGDMKAIISCTEKPLTMKDFSGLVCTGDRKIDCFYGPYRFIGYREGTPEAALKSMLAAAEKASQDKNFLAWVKQEGLDQRETWKNQEDLVNQWNQDNEDFIKLFGKK